MPALDLTGFLYAVSEVCAMYGGSVTSWWRTEARNTLVHGVHDSKHRIGAACDIVYDNGFPDLDKLRRAMVPSACRVIREHDHDHFELLLTMRAPTTVTVGAWTVILAT